MPTTVSVRAVVGGLFVFTSVAVIICSMIPIFVVLKHVAINFVLSGTAAEADKVQFVVSTALQRASLFGDILQRASFSYDQQQQHQAVMFNASSNSVIADEFSGTFWKLAQWSAATVVTRSVRIVMVATINNSFDNINNTTRWLVMSSSADASSTPPTETSVVRIVNFTSTSLIHSAESEGGGNVVADVGYFDASTTSLAPINTSGGGSRGAAAAAAVLNHRLMETTSEYEVIHVQLRRFEWAVAAPFFLVGVVWIIFMVSV